MAGQEHCNASIGSHRATNITRISDDFNKVGDMKPVVIEPCLSEAAKQQADCGVSQSKTANAR